MRQRVAASPSLPTLRIHHGYPSGPARWVSEPGISMGTTICITSSGAEAYNTPNTNRRIFALHRRAPRHRLYPPAREAEDHLIFDRMRLVGTSREYLH